MINRVYEVTCDKCGALIMRRVGVRPPLKSVRNLCTVRINNGKVLTYGGACFKENV